MRDHHFIPAKSAIFATDWQDRMAGKSTQELIEELDRSYNMQVTPGVIAMRERLQAEINCRYESRKHPAVKA